MELTESEALRAYARMLNTLDVQPLEDLLAEDFVYESQNVLEPLASRQAFLDYMRPKRQTIASAGATVYAEMGTVDTHVENQLCVILAQNDRSNLVGVVLAKVEGGLLKRLDLCIVPPPETAERSGEYPR